MPKGRHLANQIREARAQAALWKTYSHSRTAERKHEVLHAIVMAACWRAKLRRLQRQRTDANAHSNHHSQAAA